MRKTNDTSNVATFEHHNTLADTELDAVSGGIGIQREPTQHPAKVTVPDLKLS